ncbi:hypothetical protein HPB48_006047 [Haemaphysalis longicornis]|uniref:Cyclic nucleotide-binding domain-containing protein n=1 Tax=Haemaphysalis longicornis TaxID=44386 RepID=A0A9J6FQG6_HAELO|nr:hypothetical protein HPB48_006047 [Haemaphysalis longicornis]
MNVAAVVEEDDEAGHHVQSCCAWLQSRLRPRCYVAANPYQAGAVRLACAVKDRRHTCLRVVALEWDRIDFPPSFGRQEGSELFAEQYDPAEDDEVEGPKAQMQEVIDAMFERKVKAGETVIKQGDDGDNFYVISSGTYNIYVGDGSGKGGEKLVGKYEGSGSFGELALMYNMPRAATITAVTEGALWAMNRQTFRRIVLKSAFKKRKEYENLLEKVPMLKSLNEYERMNLCDALMPRSYRDGDLIIMQGDAADGMYFIEDGTVRITLKKDVSGSSCSLYAPQLSHVETAVCCYTKYVEAC